MIAFLSGYYTLQRMVEVIKHPGLSNIDFDNSLASGGSGEEKDGDAESGLPV